MGKDDVIVINQPGNLKQRTSSTGRVKYSIEVTSEPIAFNLNAKELGGAVAQQLAHYFQEKIRGISAQAAPATIAARERFAKAAAAGKTWALRRYSGGQMGSSAPNKSGALFNDSGRLADSIVARATGDGWRINVAGNRLDPRTANNGGTAAVERIWARLAQLVPAFADVSIAFRESDMLNRAAKNIVKKMAPTSKNVTVMDVVKAAVDLYRSAG